jgi:hypothetical protein
VNQTYQEHYGDVQKEGNDGVGEQGPSANAVDVFHTHVRHLPEDPDASIHNGAGRSIVVKRDKGVHLELSGTENALNHD